MKSVMRLLLPACVVVGVLHGQMRLPPFNKSVLPNGVAVYVMQRPGVPLVDIDVAVRGGRESEPESLPGLADVTADLLRKGTATYSSAQFSEALDALGGSYRADSDEQTTRIETEFLAKDFRSGLALVADAVLHATFPEKEVVKLLGQRRDDVRSLKDNPRQAISPYAHAYFFGPTHPYGRIIDEESVSRVTRSDIEQYYKRMYDAKNLIVAVVGDVEPRTAQSEVARLFGNAADGAAEAWRTDTRLDYPKTNRVLLVDKPGATQTYFYIMQPGIDAHNRDRDVLRLLNSLFGGSFTSMLNEELRVKTGLTYGVHSAIEGDRLQGMNAITTFTKTESTAKAIDLSITTMRALAIDGITADQLASAKAYLKGTLPRSLLETGDQLARQLIRLDVLGYGSDEIDNLFSRIDAITLDQANTVAKKYYRTSGLTLVLIGDAAKVRPQLARFATEIRQVKISTPGFGTQLN